jgi:hypothetical protein
MFIVMIYQKRQGPELVCHKTMSVSKSLKVIKFLLNPLTLFIVSQYDGCEAIYFLLFSPSSDLSSFKRRKLNWNMNDARSKLNWNNILEADTYEIIVWPQ